MNQSINTDSKNSKEPQQKYRLGTVSIKILGGLKPIKRKFPRRSVIVFSKDEIWPADVVDMLAFSSFNKGFKYILTVIDVFSKYARAVRIKDKSAASVTKAFEKIISDRIPKKLCMGR